MTCTRDRLKLAICALWFLTALGVVGQEQNAPPPTALMPRFALAVADDERDAVSRLILETALSQVREQVPGLWFVLDESERRTSVSQSVDETGLTLAERAWEEHQAEVLVMLLARARSDGAPRSRTLTARFYQTRPRDGSPPSGLGVWEEQVEVDGAGRYQRPEAWNTLVERVGDLAELAGPGVEIVVTSNGPLDIEGLPEWARIEINNGPPWEYRITLRGLRSYDLTFRRDRHRAQSRSFYVERRPLEVAVPLTPFPRHSIGFVVRGLSWPGIEYAWYGESLRWSARLGVTSFLLGLTPMRQIGRPDTDARLLSSHGLSEIEIGVRRILGRPERFHRLAVGVGIAGRVVHGDVEVGIDPVIPGVVRVGLDSEWELGGRLFLVQRATIDAFYSPQPAFVPEQPWVYGFPPIYAQLPVYRVGMRVRL